MNAAGLIFRNKLGRTIKAARWMRGLSQSQLAFKMQIPRSLISSWERGEKFPTVESLQRICVALNVPPATILYFAEADDAERILEAA